MTTTAIKTWDHAEDGFATAWPTFRPRPQQRAMAEAVARNWSGNATNKILMAQAGCGVGKSVAYLVPSIASGKPVVIAVSTLALQDQLAHKDLPMLRDVLFPGLKFAVLKGRSNYLCQRACDKANIAWAMKPEANGGGERSDLAHPVTDEQWREMSVDADGCVGRKQCPFGNSCFSELARKNAKEADVKIVNTSLLTQHLKLQLMTEGNASMLGPVTHYVIDEAHEMADIVAGGLSTRVTFRRITDCTAKLAYHLLDKSAPQSVAEVNGLAARFFNGSNAWFEQQKGDVRSADLSDDDRHAVKSIADALAPLELATAKARCACEPAIDPDTGEEKDFCEFARRTSTLLSDLYTFSDDAATRDVVWMEFTGRATVLCSSPAEVGGFLRSALWNPEWAKTDTRAVLCSATLAVGGDFDYIAGRLGVSDYDVQDVGSPFDFGRQARVYLAPSKAPNPSKQSQEWKIWAQEETMNLVRASDGGALLLFTSTTAMRDSYTALSARMRRELGVGVYLQGDGMPNRDLAEAFARDRRGVLFATRSFMTGVDFAGDTCRLVVMDRLPFAVPTEPVFKARCEAAEKKYGEGSSFGRVSIPDMAVILQQGAGRLIRTVDDQGVFAILDSRIRAGWAHAIRKSLPPAPTIGTVFEAAEFYRDLALAS